MEDKQALNYSQVCKLNAVLSTQMDIHSHNNFPSLQISPASLVRVVKSNLLKRGIDIDDIRMNGSAASYCICDDSSDHPQIRYNDIDLIFGVRIGEDSDFHIIKEAVMTSLLDFLPEVVSKSNITSQLLEEAYVRKMVLVSNAHNRWSLVSLGDSSSTSSATTIELKFVDKIRRKYEFTVDSFQILIDSYFDFNQCTEESPVSMSQTFFPTVSAMSVYHSYEDALDHLNNRLIHTEAPEEIRGGGLLKYCSLLVNGFVHADADKMWHLEPYMCSRFFIDFPTEEVQFSKIEKYVMSRFVKVGGDGVRKGIEFLDSLYNVVSSRARCLVESERRKTIGVIVYLRSILPFFQVPPHTAAMAFPLHHHHHHHHHHVITGLHHQNSAGHHSRNYYHSNYDSSPPPSSSSSRSSPPPTTHHYQHHHHLTTASRSKPLHPHSSYPSSQPHWRSNHYMPRPVGAVQ